MNNFHHLNKQRLMNHRLIVGFLMILSGVILFLDQKIRTGWMSYAIIPVNGLIIFYWGLRQKHPYLVLMGSLIAGVGGGIWASLFPLKNDFSILQNIGLFILLLGFSWLVIVLTTFLIRKPLWWGLVPTGVLISSGYCLISDKVSWSNYILYIGLGTGLALLTWGLLTRLLGLVIPGCLIITISLGISLAWGTSMPNNSLAQTGIMLVWFSLGWALISFFGRLISRNFLWWPLIPGGILATVGYGLLIGGDPDNALNFISNTGAIGLVIFGLYLILMRKGIHH